MTASFPDEVRLRVKDAVCAHVLFVHTDEYIFQFNFCVVGKEFFHSLIIGLRKVECVAKEEPAR